MPYKTKKKQKEYYLNNREKLKAKNREYYLKNKIIIKFKAKSRIEKNAEKLKLSRKEYYDKNKSTVLEKTKKWVLANPDKVKKIKKRYRDTHKEKRAAYNKKYGQEHREEKNAYRKAWRKINKDKVKNEKLKTKYGITIGTFNEMLKNQNNCCGICHTQFKEKVNSGYEACVDHDHNNGKIRGLICRHCNSGIGGLCDNKHYLLNAIAWLEDRKEPTKKDLLISADIEKYMHRKRHALKREYNLSVLDFKQFLIKQDGTCGICKVLFFEGVYPCVDHDHKSGKIRGLLCGKCNRALGSLKDSIQIILNSIKWIGDN